MSGGIDGLVSIFDSEVQDEDESLLQVVNHGPIHKAGFLSSEAIYALSHDEQFSIHPVTEELGDHENGPPPRRFGDLRPVLSCDYVVDVFSVAGDVFLVAGSHGRLASSEPLLDFADRDTQ